MVFELSCEELLEWLAVAANVSTVLAPFFIVCGAYWAWRQFLRQRRHEAWGTLFQAGSPLWRQGISIQAKKRAREEYELQPLLDAKDHWRNIFYSQWYLFAKDSTLVELFKAAAEEARNIARTGDMSALKRLQDELKRRMSG